MLGKAHTLDHLLPLQVHLPVHHLKEAEEVDQAEVKMAAL
jgi:hypothetical protein